MKSRKSDWLPIATLKLSLGFCRLGLAVNQKLQCVRDNLQRQQSRITTQAKTPTPPELSDASDVRVCAFTSALPWDSLLFRPAPQLAKRRPAQPTMARSLELQCPQAKRRNLALQWERSPARAEQWSAQEKSAARLAISSARAGTRCRPCSYGHKGSTTQR